MRSRSRWRWRRIRRGKEMGREGRNVLRIAVNIYSCQNIFYKQMTSFIKATQATQRDNRVELPKVGRAGRFIRVLFYASSSCCCCSINLWHEVTASSVSQSVIQSVSQSIGRHKHALKANGANTNKQIIKISLIMTADSVVAATTTTTTTKTATTATTRERIYWKLIKPDGSHNSFVCGLLIVYLLLKALPEVVFIQSAAVAVSMSQSLAVSVSQSLSVATSVSVFHLLYSHPSAACAGSNNELSSCLHQPVCRTRPVCIEFSISSLKVRPPLSFLLVPSKFSPSSLTSYLCIYSHLVLHSFNWFVDFDSTWLNHLFKIC